MSNKLRGKGQVAGLLRLEGAPPGCFISTSTGTLTVLRSEKTVTTRSRSLYPIHI